MIGEGGVAGEVRSCLFGGEHIIFLIEMLHSMVHVKSLQAHGSAICRTTGTIIMEVSFLDGVVIITHSMCPISIKDERNAIELQDFS